MILYICLLVVCILISISIWLVYDEFIYLYKLVYREELDRVLYHTSLLRYHNTETSTIDPSKELSYEKQ